MADEPAKKPTRRRSKTAAAKPAAAAPQSAPDLRSPLYDIHLRTAAKMVRGGGNFLFPTSYTSPVEEHVNVRTNIGMQDLSSMGEVDIKGPGAERLVYRLVVAEVRDMHPGQVRYCTMCDEEGRIVDDITLYKFSDEHFMIVTSSGPRKDTVRWISDHAVGTSSYVTEVSSGIALLTVQGPRSREYLMSVVQDGDVEGIRFFRFGSAVINGTNVLVSRTGYTGELGYELYVPSEYAIAMWEYIASRGKEYGLMPYGVGAMQSLRIEKAYPLAGPDINGWQTPFHVGLHRFIDFKKREFVGRDALLSWQDAGLDRRWTGLVLDGKVPASSGDAIYSIADISSFRERMFSGSEAGDFFDQEQPGMEMIGEVTSSAKGHTVGKMLALAYLRVTHSWPGARVLVNVSGRPVLAEVVNTPFFDPANARIRARGTRKV